MYLDYKYYFIYFYILIIIRLYKLAKENYIKLRYYYLIILLNIIDKILEFIIIYFNLFY